MSYHAIQSIIEIVERVCEVQPGAIRSRNKCASYVHARRVAMALIGDHFPHAGQVETAKAMGFRDHSSVIFYRRQVEKREIRGHSDYMAAKLLVAFRFGLQRDAAAAE